MDRDHLDKDQLNKDQVDIVVHRDVASNVNHGIIIVTNVNEDVTAVNGHDIFVLYANITT